MQDSYNSSAQELRTRMLMRVLLDDGGSYTHRELLHRSFRRMFDSPVARHLAGIFLDKEMVATVRFAPMEGSAYCMLDGCLAFAGPRAHAMQDGQSALILLNEKYLGSGDDYVLRDLPPALAHELFGHALSSAMAEKEGLAQVFRHCSLNEIHARLVGWLVDMELDGRIERSGAEEYLCDPAAFMAKLKFDDPFYAVTFSVEEMADVRQAMKRRLAEALQKRESLSGELVRSSLHLRAIGHFVREHGVPEAQFRDLRRELEDRDAVLRLEQGKLDRIVEILAQTIRRCSEETDGQFEKSFRDASDHRFLAEMRGRIVTMSGQLAALVRDAVWSPFAQSVQPHSQRGAAAPHAYAIEELIVLMEQDRLENPHHWPIT